MGGECLHVLSGGSSVAWGVLGSFAAFLVTGLAPAAVRALKEERTLEFSPTNACLFGVVVLAVIVAGAVAGLVAEPVSRSDGIVWGLSASSFFVGVGRIGEAALSD